MDRIGTPLFFSSYFSERIWGGTLLRHLLGKNLPIGKTIGESWEICDRLKEQTQIVGGPFDGADLGALRAARPLALLGAQLAARKPKYFPLLAKFIDATQDLSVQVHPDDEGCRRLGIPDRGKSECWVVIHAEPGARIQRGMKPGVTRADFENALQTGHVQKLLHYFKVHAGDTIAIPPGTVHAIGAGIVLAEIQQNSDVTFRVYDYLRPGLNGKPRALHISEALETIRFDRHADGFFQGNMQSDTVEGTQFNLGPYARMTWLLKGRYFDLQRVELQSGAQVLPQRSPDTPTLLIFLSGHGELARRKVQAGSSVLLPADMPVNEHSVLKAEGLQPMVWLASEPTGEA